MSRIEQHSLEQVLATAKLEQVVGQFVALSPRGANRKGDCPFCNEKKKFSVSVAKQLYHCFHCKEGGNSPIKFLQKAKGMTFPEAAKWVADFYKMELRHEAKDSATGTGGDFDRSYFDQRMAELGYHQNRPDTKGLFRPHSSGDIEIRFPELRETDADGNDLPPWQQDGQDDFVRRRLHPSRTSSTQKYSQSKDSGVHIFIPPRVVQMYRKAELQQVLYVVEGEFKAFAMAEQGVPIVGVTGIWMWQRAAKKKELHPDIMELLRVLKCVSVVFVMDADCMQVKWDRIADPEKDLAKRLKDFAGAVSGFRMAVGTLVQRVYFSRIRAEFVDNGKGLDDLAQLKGAEEVATQLQVLGRNPLFVVEDLTNATYRKINGFFHLNMYQGVPKDFYETYARQLEDFSWCFNGAMYRWDPDAQGDQKLIMERHQDSKLFVRVGCDYFRYGEKRDEHDQPIMALMSWKEGIINRDYVHKGWKNFFDTIESFDAFDTIPGHHDDYQPWIETQTGRLFNRYKPLRSKPVKGSWAHIEMYLRHVFGDDIVRSIDGKGVERASSPRWIAFMDHLTIMYRFPLQRLPGVALVSEKKKTGKSKLLELLCAMYEANAVLMGNDQLTDEFNSDWVAMQCVCVDETLLERKHQQERMKRLITGSREQMRGMYKDREMVKLIAKFFFTSNNEDNFIALDDDEMRYLVINVPPIAEDKRDPLLLDKMVLEIPAFFHELRTRAIVHPKLDRLWFADSVIETEARKEVARNSKGWCEGDLRTFIEEQFYTIRWPELYFPLWRITKMMSDGMGVKYRPKEVKRVLTKVMKVEEIFDRVLVPFDPERRQREKKTGERDKQRFYVFRACDFLPPNVAADIMLSARAEWSTSTDRLDMLGSEEKLPLHMKHPEPETLAA